MGRYHQWCTAASILSPAPSFIFLLLLYFSTGKPFCRRRGSVYARACPAIPHTIFRPFPISVLRSLSQVPSACNSYYIQQGSRCLHHFFFELFCFPEYFQACALYPFPAHELWLVNFQIPDLFIVFFNFNMIKRHMPGVCLHSLFFGIMQGFISHFRQQKLGITRPKLSFTLSPPYGGSVNILQIRLCLAAGLNLHLVFCIVS